MTVLKTWSENKPGPAWPKRTSWLLATGTQVLLGFGYLINVGLGRLGMLQLLLIFSLLDPLSIFLSTVRDVARGRIKQGAEDA